MDLPVLLYGLASWTLWFYAYSFAGWVWEVLYTLVKLKTFVNRGFVFGPVLPIYGVGALMAIGLLGPIHSVALQFVAGCAAAAVLEYATSWAMEKLFHARWWDYTDEPFNLNGRICLKGVALFGIMMVAVVQLIHPAVATATQLLGPVALLLVSGTLNCLFMVDLAVTVVRLQAFNGKLEIIQHRIESLAAKAREVASDAADSVGGRVAAARATVSESVCGRVAHAKAGIADAKVAASGLAGAARANIAELVEELPSARQFVANLRAMLTPYERHAGRDPFFRPTRNREAFEWFCTRVLGLDPRNGQPNQNDETEQENDRMREGR